MCGRTYVRVFVCLMQSSMLLFILFEEPGLAGNYLFDPFSIIFANSLLSVSFALLAFRCELFTPGTAGTQSGTFREDSVHCETGNILRAVKEPNAKLQMSGLHTTWTVEKLYK